MSYLFVSLLLGRIQASADKIIFQRGDQIRSVRNMLIQIFLTFPGLINQNTGFVFCHRNNIGKQSTHPKILQNGIFTHAGEILQSQLVFDNIVLGFNRPTHKVKRHKLAIFHPSQVGDERFGLTGGQSQLNYPDNCPVRQGHKRPGIGVIHIGIPFCSHTHYKGKMPFQQRQDQFQ